MVCYGEEVWNYLILYLLALSFDGFIIVLSPGHCFGCRELEENKEEAVHASGVSNGAKQVAIISDYTSTSLSIKFL